MLRVLSALAAVAARPEATAFSEGINDSVGDSFATRETVPDGADGVRGTFAVAADEFDVDFFAFTDLATGASLEHPLHGAPAIRPARSSTSSWTSSGARCRRSAATTQRAPAGYGEGTEPASGQLVLSVEVREPEFVPHAVALAAERAVVAGAFHCAPRGSGANACLVGSRSPSPHRLIVDLPRVGTCRAASLRESGAVRSTAQCHCAGAARAGDAAEPSPEAM